MTAQQRSQARDEQQDGQGDPQYPPRPAATRCRGDRVGELAQVLPLRFRRVPGDEHEASRADEKRHGQTGDPGRMQC